MNVPGVHIAGKTMSDGLKETNFMGGFPLSWKWVPGETPLDILEMSHLHYMFGKQHEWDGIDYFGKTCVNMKCEKDLGWKTKGLSTQRRDPPFLANEGILYLQMDKCSMTLDKQIQSSVAHWREKGKRLL